MPVDPELVETIQRIVDSRIEPIRVHREEHEELKAGQRRLEESHARVEDELARLAAAQRETQESLLRFQRSTEEHLNALTAAQARTEERLSRVEERLEQLAAAQARTDERLEQLAAAQARTEERLEQLVAAQARTEERFEQLAAAMARTDERFEQLAAAQARTEDRLGEALRGLRQEIGGLSERLGGDLEEIGRIVVAEFLRVEEGVELPSLEGRYLRVDGEEIEVDLFGEGHRRGEPVVVIGECKARVVPRELETFYRRTERFASSLAKVVVRVVYCQRAHPDAERFARERGIIFVPWSYQHRIWAQGA